jgi:mono/diheme cytochrome c family protein
MKTKFWVAAGLSIIILAGVGFSVRKVSSAADATATFNSKCATCHGRDGRGQTKRGRRAHTRDLTVAAWQDDVSDERLFNSINNGRGKMPAFKKYLSENEVDALVSYVRRLRR